MNFLQILLKEKREKTHLEHNALSNIKYKWFNYIYNILSNISIYLPTRN